MTPPLVGLLGVDIGGTKTSAVLFDHAHRPRFRLQTPTPARRGPAAVAGQALNLAARVLREAAGHRLSVLSVGIGTAGVVGRDGRTIAAATDALPGWAGTPLADMAEERLDLPARLVGDVQAFLIGELAAGAARGSQTAIGVMAGTGIGGAVAVGGEILLGANGAAGNLGHMPVPSAVGLECPCGTRGHVEAVASGPAMAARYGDLSGGPTADLRAVAAAAAAGDDLARYVLRAGGMALGEALAATVAVADPDVVVVAGGVLNSGPWYEEALRACLADCVLPILRDVSLVPAGLDADGVALGAAVHAARQARASHG
ncbi:ROK family protein [Streptomyces griseoluteus]|uniref:ROK family protein n=1 Tax=Streptomyces griseoluteus TaxID=29306 RepID=UPI003827B784